MALIKCRECGKEISTNASSCPHCGYVYKKETSTKKIVIVTLITLAVLFILGLSSIYLIDSLIPNIKSKNVMKKYYGTWELVNIDSEKLEDNTINWNFIVADDFKKELIINVENLENQVTGFNDPKGEYAITYFDRKKDDYILFANISQMVNRDDLRGIDSKKVCFKLNNDTLYQIECTMDEAIPNANIQYKLKSK